MCLNFPFSSSASCTTEGPHHVQSRALASLYNLANAGWQKGVQTFEWGVARRLHKANSVMAVISSKGLANRTIAPLPTFYTLYDLHGLNLHYGFSFSFSPENSCLQKYSATLNSWAMLCSQVGTIWCPLGFRLYFLQVFCHWRGQLLIKNTKKEPGCLINNRDLQVKLVLLQNRGELLLCDSHEEGVSSSVPQIIYVFSPQQIFYWFSVSLAYLEPLKLHDTFCRPRQHPREYTINMYRTLLKIPKWLQPVYILLQPIGGDLIIMLGQHSQWRQLYFTSYNFSRYPQIRH